jgi:hypothetical protein
MMLQVYLENPYRPGIVSSKLSLILCTNFINVNRCNFDSSSTGASVTFLCVSHMAVELCMVNVLPAARVRDPTHK